MSSITYNWKRYWRPRGDPRIVTETDSSHLLSIGMAEASGLRRLTYEDIADVPCLILLGEPGMGKTHAMKSAYESVRNNTKAASEEFMRLDLQTYGNEDRFVADLSRRGKFQEWRENGCQSRLYLFLDSLDEGLLRIETIAAILVDELRKVSVENLYLRIACRSGDWPASLEAELKRLWSVAQDDPPLVQVFDLVPLSQDDIAKAVEYHQIDPATFLKEIDRRGAQALAEKPITLKFLINTYKTSGLVTDSVELFLDGLKLLCEESNPARRDLRSVGQLSSEARLAIAARIAVISVFGNRAAVWTDVDDGSVPMDDVRIESLCGGAEYTLRDLKVEVSESAVRETLSTALFLSVAPYRIGWSHHTYAEFLAAWYIVNHSLTGAQLRELFTHTEGTTRELIPQLRHTAVWLAQMNHDFVADVLTYDPEVLLDSDLESLSDADKARLIAQLLELSEHRKLRTLSRTWGRLHLSYPGLPEQLRAVIYDQGRALEVRLDAVKIAASCQLRELADDFVDLLLDVTQPLVLRQRVACLLRSFALEEVDFRLVKLIFPNGSDPSDEIRGCLLNMLWPADVTLEELFEALTLPKQPRFIGTYHLFLTNLAAYTFAREELPVALAWVTGVAGGHQLDWVFSDLVGSILLQAWDYLEHPSIAKALARAILATHNVTQLTAGRTGDKSLLQVIADDDERRRQLLDSIVEVLAQDGNDPDLLNWLPFAIVVPEDASHMLLRFRQAESKTIQDLWAEIIKQIAPWRNAKSSRAVFRACLESKTVRIDYKGSRFLVLFLAGYLPWVFRVYKYARRHITELKYKLKLKRPLISPRFRGSRLSPPRRVVKILRRFEKGNLDSWWHLMREMTLQRDSTRYPIKLELEADIRRLPGWKNASTGIRRRIMAAARRYLLKYQMGSHSWLQPGKPHRPAAAGYKALRLVMAEDPEFFNGLPSDRWRHWAIPILTTWISGDASEHEIQRALIGVAYKYAAQEIIQAIFSLMEQDDTDHELLTFLPLLEACWDSELGQAFLKKVQSPTLSPPSQSVLLAELLDRSVAGAKDYALSLMVARSPDEKKCRTRAALAAAQILMHTEDAGWDVVWPVLQEDTEFGREVIEIVATDIDEKRSANIVQKLDEKQLADLFVWLARQYPPSEDTWVDGAVTTRESVAMWRNSVLLRLRQAATPEAISAIERVQEELPDLRGLSRAQTEIEERVLRASWRPLQPEEILALATDPSVHIVQSERDSSDETEKSNMPSLSPDLHNRLRTILLRCNEFDKDASLRTVFITHRLYPFRHSLPSANAKGERVDMVLDYLIEQETSDQEPVLSIFLRALRDRYMPGNALRDELDALARDVEQILSSSPPDPEKTGSLRDVLIVAPEKDGTPSQAGPAQWFSQLRVESSQPLVGLWAQIQDVRRLDHCGDQPGKPLSRFVQTKLSWAVNHGYFGPISMAPRSRGGGKCLDLAWHARADPPFPDDELRVASALDDGDRDAEKWNKRQDFIPLKPGYYRFVIRFFAQGFAPAVYEYCLYWPGVGRENEIHLTELKLSRGRAGRLRRLTAQPPTLISNRYALLIGVRDYVDPNYPSLPHTVHDVVELERELRAFGYIVRSLHNDQVDEALLPTRDNIWGELERLVKFTGAGDLLLVYFGGHGTLAEDRAYLLPSHARQPALRRTAIDLDEFKTELSDAGAQARVLLLDACHAGIGRDVQGMEAAFERHVYMEATGTAVLASCRRGEIAYEHHESPHGAFTHYLLEGLHGAAAQKGNHIISVNMLNAYVTASVKRWAIDQGLQQWPNANAQLVGDPPLVELDKRISDTENVSPLPFAQKEGRLLRKYLQHSYHVNAIAVTSDDAYLASCSGDLRAIVWDVKTGEVVSIFKQERWVGAVSFDPDDRLMATTNGNGVVRLWDFRAEELEAEQSAHPGACRTVAFSPDGKLVASGGIDAKIHIWAAPDLSLIHTLEAHRDEVRRLTFSPDGTMLVSGGADGLLYLWNLEQRTPALLLERPHTMFRSVAFASEGGLIGATDSNGVVWIWDVANHVVRWHVEGHEGQAIGISFQPNGQLVATGGQDHLIRLWDARSGRLIDTIEGHEDTVTNLIFSHDGRWLFSGSRDNTVCLWRV
jgi:WD40 repeat protein